MRGEPKWDVVDETRDGVVRRSVMGDCGVWKSEKSPSWFSPVFPGSCLCRIF